MRKTPTRRPKRNERAKPRAGEAHAKPSSSETASEIYAVVRAIPRGKVATYGQIAAILGQPRGARAVGMALGALRDDAIESVPWQRVIGAAGRCTHRDGFAAGIQQEMLEAEGVAFDRRGHLDLHVVRWKGPAREWVTKLQREL